MDLYQWIGIALGLYGVPFTIGLCVARPSTAILLAIASFSGLHASIWSALGPLSCFFAAPLLSRKIIVDLILLCWLAKRWSSPQLGWYRDNCYLGRGMRRPTPTHCDALPNNQSA